MAARRVRPRRSSTLGPRAAITSWLEQTPSSRLLFIRRPGRARASAGRVFVVRAAEREPQVRRLELDADGLADVDLGGDGEVVDSARARLRARHARCVLRAPRKRRVRRVAGDRAGGRPVALVASGRPPLRRERARASGRHPARPRVPRRRGASRGRRAPGPDRPRALPRPHRVHGARAGCRARRSRVPRTRVARRT